MSLTMHFTGYGKEHFSKNLINYINEELEKCNLPIYQDKHIKLPPEDEFPGFSWNRRELDNLQFIAIKQVNHPTWRPPENSIYDFKIDRDCYQKFDNENNSHLICCNRLKGTLFVPIKFPKNALLNCNHHLSDFGSSINLSEELKIMAYKLGFDLRKYDPDISLKEDELLEYEKYIIFKWYTMAIFSVNYNLILELN
jgi:hypothetical protein